MLITYLQRFSLMLALVAAQMLVFNHMSILGLATPLPFVYLLLTFPLGTERWEILLWGFACGLLTDIVSLTPGVGAAAMTLTALVQPPFLRLMAPKDSVEDLRPGYDTMGFWLYVRYALVLTLIFALAYFAVLAFSFRHILDLSLSFITSWALTFLLCLVFEGFHRKHDE